jgi:cysteine desulfurase family protein (TIGR01976 family)
MTAPAQTSSMIPVEGIRSHFPALDRLQGENRVAYFDGPGGTQVPRAVVDAVTDYLYHHNANTNWAFATSIETDEIIAHAREAVADFLNASPSEVVFGANMTTLTFHLSRALGRDFGPRDEIVVTELDHQGNVAPWQALAKERGVTVRVARMIPETGQLDWQDLQEKVNKWTKLVAVGVASNALGTINDVRRAAELAHDVKALFFADAVHSAPHLLTDVTIWDCDFLACSAYKFYGPHVGILFGKSDLLESIDFPKVAPAPDVPPDRAETGTKIHEGIAGTAAAIDFLASLAGGASRRERLRAAFEGLEQRGRELAAQMCNGLAGIPGVRIFGPLPTAPRTPTVAFTVQGVASADVAHALADLGVFVSHGDFYASTVVERLGVRKGGLVRAGCACYTTVEEVDRLVQGVRSIARRAQ